MYDIRQTLAAWTPAFIRKLVRMIEHYGRRHIEWFQVLREMRGVAWADKITLASSAAAAPVTALAHLDGFQPPRLLRDADLHVRGVGCFAIRAGTDDIIHVLGARERAMLAIIEKSLERGDVFIDAGANVGFYAVLASRLVGPTGRVVAFEMMPPTLARLRHHLERNAATNVTVIGGALADREGDTVVATSRPDKFGQASIIASNDEVERTVRYELTTVTLDSALAAFGDIACIKMDLEGAEYLALCGGPAVLRRTAAILFESNSHDARIFALLETAGFSIEQVDANDYLARRASRAGK